MQWTDAQIQAWRRRTDPEGHEPDALPPAGKRLPTSRASAPANTAVDVSAAVAAAAAAAAVVATS